MPSHWSNPKLHIVTPSSATATQCLHAIGCAEAGRFYSRHPKASAPPPDQGFGDYRDWKNVTFHGDEVTYVSIGEGSTSQGEFWESLSTASNSKLPVLYVVEDNGYAISTPVEANTPGGSISRLIATSPTSISRRSTAPTRSPPTLPWWRRSHTAARVTARRSSMDMSSAPTRTRSPTTSGSTAARPRCRPTPLRDPIASMQLWLLREGILDAEAITRLEREVDAEVQRAADRAVSAVLPEATPAAIERHVYSEDLNAHRPRFQTQPQATADTSERTMAELINHCLKDEMRRDERIVVFGEDVADATRDEPLRAGKLKGKGGVFKLTAGLQTEFGNDRCFNSPLAEANIVGRAIGMAARGSSPSSKSSSSITSGPPCTRCAMSSPPSAGGPTEPGRPLLSSAARSAAILRVAPSTTRSQAKASSPTRRASAWSCRRTHSMPRASFAPPSAATIPSSSWSTSGSTARPSAAASTRARNTPFPSAKPISSAPGRHLTVITYGAVVPRALQAAERLHRDAGVDVEVIDLRSLSPYDWDAIATSVRKTSRVIVAHEDMQSWGYGAEIAARIADELFDSLDAPVRRVAAMDTFCAYQPLLEDVILPQPEHLYRAMSELSRY